MGCIVQIMTMNAFIYTYAHIKLFLFVDEKLGKKKKAATCFQLWLNIQLFVTEAMNVVYVSTLGILALRVYSLPQLEAQLNLQPLKN